MRIYISRTGILSERGDRAAKVGGWMVRGLIVPLCREGTTERQKPTGRRDLVGRIWGRGQKAACLCLLPWTKGWQKMISAGCRERLTKNDGLSMEGDENERAYEIVCTADESG